METFCVVPLLSVDRHYRRKALISLQFIFILLVFIIIFLISFNILLTTVIIIIIVICSIYNNDDDNITLKKNKPILESLHLDLILEIFMILIQKISL